MVNNKDNNFLETSFLLEEFNNLCDEAKKYWLNAIYELIRTVEPQKVLYFMWNCDVCDIKDASPIEQIFTIAFYYILSINNIDDIKMFSQYKVKKYCVDFYIEYNGKKYAIELDGFDYHSNKKQMNYDYKREQDLNELGYRVIRFTGSQVFNSPFDCAIKLLNIIKGNENA